MGLATDGAWTGSLSGAEIDGVDVWDSISVGAASPRDYIVHFVDTHGNCSIQKSMLKVGVRGRGRVGWSTGWSIADRLAYGGFLGGG